MTIGITGGSGQLARLTADLVLEKVTPSELVLVTRDPSKLDDYARRGVAVRRGDFNEPGSLPEAFAGIERLLLVSTPDVGERIRQHGAAIDAAKQAGVRHIAYTSILNPSESNPAAAVPDHRGTEEALRASGLQWTMLRNGIYSVNQVDALKAAVETGSFVHNWGQGSVAHVAREDCAAVAAAVLTGEGHEGKAYDVTGPDLLSATDSAALASEVGGKPVEAVDLDDEAWVAAMVEHAGLPEPVAQFVATFGRAIREGHLSACTTVVRDLTGREPIRLRDQLAAALAAS